jgi:putative ABC transport system substrate-binding protein
MMDRRIFVSTAAGALLVTALPAVAQPAAKVYRIGVLSLSEFNKTTLGKVLIEPLATRGYVLGQNIVFEERSAEGKVERLPVLAAELVQLKVDLIVAGPAVAIRAAHNATTTIPIVMAFSADDPVKSGFVTSLARPGGNVTGVTAQARDLAPKWMELLRDAVPGITRIAVLTNSLRPEHAEYVKMMQMGQPTGLQLQPVEVRGPDQYESAFAAMTKEHADAVIILGDVMFTRDSGRLAELAVSHRLPSIYLFKAFVVSGGLLAYGPDEGQLLDLATQYIDKILKGANPADLPVEQPTKFRLAINQKTAKALGLTISESLLLRADDVIH